MKLLVCDGHKGAFVFLLNGQSPLKVHIRHKPTNLGQICFVAYREESTYVLYKCIHLTVFTGKWTINTQPSSVTSLPLTS